MARTKIQSENFIKGKKLKSGCSTVMVLEPCYHPQRILSVFEVKRLIAFIVEVMPPSPLPHKKKI